MSIYNPFTRIVYPDPRKKKYEPAVPSQHILTPFYSYSTYTRSHGISVTKSASRQRRAADAKANVMGPAMILPSSYVLFAITP